MIVHRDEFYDPINVYIESHTRSAGAQKRRLNLWTRGGVKNKNPFHEIPADKKSC